MRKSVENISLLQKQINDLQLENQILKNILERSGISYTHEISRISEPENTEEYDPDQGARIIHPGQITDEMANLFYARFWGRQDVYARRSEKKATGEAGYYTQCHNRWENICPKMRHEKMNCKDCPHQSYKQLTVNDILAHLYGKSQPDDYGFGDAAFWMQLHEDMRQAGFFVKSVEDSCENFAVIDQEIIWYGNIHLLGKEKIEDNMMRVNDKKIAAELMELAFK